MSAPETQPTTCAACWSPHTCGQVGNCLHAQSAAPEPVPDTADAVQIGGDHYKAFGDYQPWKVFEKWYPTEEFLAYLMMSAIAYLPRERHKGGVMDVEKAIHTLQKWVEVRKANPVTKQ